MGLEAECSVRFAGKSARGKAQVEERQIVFRGGFRLVIPLAEVESADVSAGTLRVRFARGVADFELGAQAEKWALKIRHPKSRIDKLGVKPGMRVAVLGVGDAAFRNELRERAADLVEGRPGKRRDLVFAAMSKRGDLASLPALRAAIVPAGAIWVIWPKGRREFREDDVRAACPGAGLVDVKVVSFSDTLSGLKLMIPKRLR